LIEGIEASLEDGGVLELSTFGHHDDEVVVELSKLVLN
jgi:hypothetical protein